jgi:RecA/RadA recombinase
MKKQTIKKIKPKKKTTTIVDSVKQSAQTPPQIDEDIDFSQVISTGSTLLDLAISGTRIYGGGIPGGILISIRGASSTGKSALLAEMAASTQIRKGETHFLDTEARINKMFAATFGMDIPEEQLLLTKTVEDFQKDLLTWQPKDTSVINLYAVDSLSSLCSTMELEGEDKMGMKRAKGFSETFRKSAVLIKETNMIVACTNQLRTSKNGRSTISGGVAQGFHASLTLDLKPNFPKSKITISRTLASKKKIEKHIGILTNVTVSKSSIDTPFRSALLMIRFDSGIDDVSANLQYIKDIHQTTSYDVFDKTIGTLEKAAIYIENHDYEDKLREQTIQTWLEVEALFKSTRKKKKRR